MARKRGITIDDVIASASRLSDEEGWEALTLAGVARMLGIRSPSLYAHVEGLDGLRRALAIHAAGEMGRALRKAAGRRKGTEALRAISHAYRCHAHQHPGGYAAVQQAVPPGEDDELYQALGSVVEPVVAALAEAGVASDQRIHMARALRSGLHGFVELERVGGFGLPDSVAESFDRLLDLLMAGVHAVGDEAEVEPRSQ